jgi:hypothetical protein
MFVFRLRGRIDILVPVTPYLAGIFQHLQKNKKLSPRVQAVDMLRILLLLQFILDGLLEDVVQEQNRNFPLLPVYDPSKELIEITMLFIQWYMLYHRRFPPKDEVDVKKMIALGAKGCTYLTYSTYVTYSTNYLILTYSFDCFRYQEQCLVVFPYKNKHDHPFMATGKVHSIKHTPTAVVNYCNAINASCEAPETAHKDWVKNQGDCTNQGPHVQVNMMMHSLCKEAASMLSEGVQGNS